MKKMATSPPPFMHSRDGSGPKARFIWDVILVSDTFFSVAIVTCYISYANSKPDISNLRPGTEWPVFLGPDPSLIAQYIIVFK